MLFAREVIVRGQKWIFDPAGRHVWPPDPGPYEPCWCFSGGNFRFCHQRKHLEEPLSLAESLRRWDQATSLKICLHPSAPTGCSSTIVEAHTIQRQGGGLKSIARGGKVYGFKLHPMFFIRRQQYLQPELVGIRDASTFTGFCSAHDGELFRAVEAKPFTASWEQLFLLSFRCVARRLHAVESAIRNESLFADVDRGLDRDNQRRIFVAMEARRTTNRVGAENLRVIKRIYDDGWNAKTADVRGFIVRLEGAPEFMTSTIVDVDFDFLGRTIDPIHPPEHLCFGTVSVDDSNVAIWSWLGPNRAAEQLCRSFEMLPDSKKSAALLQYALEFTDSPYFAPDWWETLSVKQRQRIVERLTAHVQPFAERANTALLDDALGATRVSSVRTEHVGNW